MISKGYSGFLWAQDPPKNTLKTACTIKSKTDELFLDMIAA